MVVELRKRKAPPPAPEPPAKKPSKAPKAVAKIKEAITGKSDEPAEPTKPAEPIKSNGAASAPAGKPVVGDTINLDGFGGEVETHEGKKTTLKALVDESKSGVVLFTYPRASTPGCTTQACLFRDNYELFTAGGFAIYGLSTDSPKANTTFKTNKKLPYALLCDPKATLIGAIGLKKAPKGTTRGVFAVDKAGKVLLAEPGGPAATVEAVKNLVGESNNEKTATLAPTVDSTVTDAKDEPVIEKSAAEETKPIADKTPAETATTTAVEAKPEETTAITDLKPAEA